MRAVLDFPDGFGSDPTLMPGPAGMRGIQRTVSSDIASPTTLLDTATGPAHVPGPFRAASHLGTVASDAKMDTTTSASFLSGGFRPSILEDVEGDGQDPSTREPQSVVLTAMIVGMLLAAFGYFLDLH